MQLLLNVLVHDVWLPKGKEENKTEVGRKGDGPLNPLEVTSARREGLEKWGRYNNNGCCFFVCTSVIGNNHQLENKSMIFGRLGAFAHAGSYKLCTSCSRKSGTAA